MKRKWRCWSPIKRISEDTKLVSAGFGIFTLVIVPIFSLLFFYFDNPFLYTMSYMGNNGHRITFIVWGILTATLLSMFSIRIYNSFSYQNKRSRRLMSWSYLFLILTVFIPSLQEMPTLSRFHVYTAVAYGASITFSLFFFLIYVRSLDRKVGNKSMILYFATLGVPVGALFVFGHSGVYEVLFFVTISVFLFLLDRVILPQSKKYQHITRRNK